jgi:hypothetical protein
MAKGKNHRAPPKPLRGFDFGLVNEKMEGLLTNVDRDLQRRAQQALRGGHIDSERCLSLLNIMMRSRTIRTMRFAICAPIPRKTPTENQTMYW